MQRLHPRSNLLNNHRANITGSPRVPSRSTSRASIYPRRRSSVDSDNEAPSFQNIEDILSNVLPLLGSKILKVRQGVTWAVGSINPSHYHVLWRELQPLIFSVTHNINTRIKGSHSSIRELSPENVYYNNLRVGISQILSRTSTFIVSEISNINQKLLTPITEFIQCMVLFFSLPDVQAEYDHFLSRFNQ